MAFLLVACNSEEKQTPVVEKPAAPVAVVDSAKDTTVVDTVEVSSSSAPVSSSVEAVSSSSVQDTIAVAPKDTLPPDTVKKDTVVADTARADTVAADTAAADTAAVDTAAADTTVQDTSYCAEVPAGTLCDMRDGHIYRMARIGSQVWMAENLNYASENSWCYKGKLENCSAYGRLYLWTAALDLPAEYATKSAGSLVQAKHRGVCPEGWFLPSHADMRKLVEYVLKANADNGFASEEVGTSLKKTSGWEENDEEIVGTDRYGFGAKAAGYRNPQGQFAFVHEDADFWVAEESSEPTHAPYWNMYYANQNFLGDYNNLKTFAYSVRCIKK